MSVDRAGLETILRQHIKVDATGLAPAVASAYVVGFEEATNAIVAALRQPDQKGEAVDLRAAIHAWIREDVPLAGKMNLLPGHVDALVARIASAQPAPAAGMLPSREALARVIVKYQKGAEGAWREALPVADTILALFAAAQPPVPTGETEDGGERVQDLHGLVARLRVEAASWRREDAHVARDEESQAAFAAEAADAIEAQVRTIAEMVEALRPFVETWNVAVAAHPGWLDVPDDKHIGWAGGAWGIYVRDLRRAARATSGRA